MILKIVALFLVFVAVLGMFGKAKLLLPRRLRSAQCGKCGRFRIGKGPCPCDAA